MPIPDEPASRRDLERLEGTVERVRRMVENLPDKISDRYVEQKVYDEQHRNQKEDIDFLKKVVYSVAAFVLAGVGTAILGLVLIR